MQSCREVGSFAHYRHLVATRAAANITYNYNARGNTDTYRERIDWQCYSEFELANRLNDIKGSKHRTRRVVLMSLGKTEIDEQAITDVTCHVTIITAH